MFIFGYGSLINIESAQETLLRELHLADLIPANLQGYKRTWTLCERIISASLKHEVSAAFLDISLSSGSHLNGVLIEINSSELDRLKLRERNYDCIEVGNATTSYDGKSMADTNIFTFVAKDKFRTFGANATIYVMRKYLEKVELGCQNLGEQFFSEYRATTESIPFAVMDGNYSFVEMEEPASAGH